MLAAVADVYESSFSCVAARCASGISSLHGKMVEHPLLGPRRAGLECPVHLKCRLLVLTCLERGQARLPRAHRSAISFSPPRSSSTPGWQLEAHIEELVGLCGLLRTTMFSLSICISIYNRVRNTVWMLVPECAQLLGARFLVFGAI